MSDVEVIGVSLESKVAGGEWKWGALYGQPHHGCSRLPVYGVRVGDALIVRVRRSRDGWEIIKVLKAPPHAMPIDHGEPDDDALELPPPSADRRPIEIGDVLVWRFPFSKDDGSERSSKRRPCVVTAVLADGYEVHPIYGTNTSLFKTGGARRLVDWKAIGLRKPSGVSAGSFHVPQEAARTRVGRIGPEDRRRLLGEGADTPGP